MNLRMLLVGLAALVFGATAALLTRPGPDASRPTITTGKPDVGGPFSLVDQTGKAVTDKDFRGKYMLVFFGYTFCPDVCPAGLQVISAALDQLGKDGEQITPVLITIDPERDTPQKLAEYVKSFHPRLVGLTGTPQQVSAAIKAYRVYAKKVPDERNPGDYTMDHSAIVYIMGPDGQLVTFTPESSKPDALALVLRRAIGAR